MSDRIERMVEQVHAGFNSLLRKKDAEIARLSASNAELLAACQMEEASNQWEMDEFPYKKLCDLWAKNGWDYQENMVAFYERFLRNAIAHAQEAAQ